VRCRLALLGVMALLACGGGNKTGLALANVGIGMAASGFSRAAGGCYAMCLGTDVCNPDTGLCEHNPCAGCGASQRCELSGPVPRCVNDSLPADLVRPPPTPDAPLVVPLP
jgi:hypothetical protein